MAVMAMRAILLALLGYLQISDGWQMRHPVRLIRPQSTHSGHNLRMALSSSHTLLPSHPDLISGKLSNGLEYHILPHAAPPGRFEAHLEILSGSIDELEHQQGMAHLMEHVAYMGSPKRTLLSGTGSKTNAYTDFHHTVFFTSCPVLKPDDFYQGPMLPMAFDALLDVLQTKVGPSRLEAERAAVLSEAAMVNKVEYRVECAILSALHTENFLPTRFPIGKEALIKAWAAADLQAFHQAHYRTDNAVLYVVGDLVTENVLQEVERKFGHLLPRSEQELQAIASASSHPSPNMRNIHRHYPPLLHRWSSPSTGTLSVPEDLRLPVPATVFQQPLLQATSLHLLGKAPIEPITSREALRAHLTDQLACTALGVRLAILHRDAMGASFVDATSSTWSREGAIVRSIDLAVSSDDWAEALGIVLGEVRRLTTYGLQQAELRRAKASVLAMAVSKDGADTSEDVLKDLMASVASAGTVLSPAQRRLIITEELDDIDAEMVQTAAMRVWGYLDANSPDTPSAVVVCSPTAITSEEVVQAFKAGQELALPRMDHEIIPETLYRDEDLLTQACLTKRCIEEAKEGTDTIVLRGELGNRMRLHMQSLREGEGMGQFCMRLLVPGGRAVEETTSTAEKVPLGTVLLGARSMQEGGALAGFSREAVELFCIDHNINVEVTASEDALRIDISTSSSPSEVQAAFQVLHGICTSFLFEEDAVDRARQSLREEHTSTTSSVEGAARQTLLHSLSGGDPRAVFPAEEVLEAVTLAHIDDTMTSLIRDSPKTVIMSGDLDIWEMEQLSLKYLGSIPEPGSAAATAGRDHLADHLPPVPVVGGMTLAPQTLGAGRLLSVQLEDNEERAYGLLGGAIGRAHPAHLEVLTEVINRRLFSIVREERQLTYDASCVLSDSATSSAERALPGYYTVAVTSTPALVHEAVHACVDAMRLKYLTPDILQASKRSVMQRRDDEVKTHVDFLSHYERPRDFKEVCENMTLSDLQDLVRRMDFSPERMTVVVAVAKPAAATADAE